MFMSEENPGPYLEKLRSSSIGRLSIDSQNRCDLTLFGSDEEFPISVQGEPVMFQTIPEDLRLYGTTQKHKVTLIGLRSNLIFGGNVSEFREMNFSCDYVLIGSHIDTGCKVTNLHIPTKHFKNVNGGIRFDNFIDFVQSHNDYLRGQSQDQDQRAVLTWDRATDSASFGKGSLEVGNGVEGIGEVGRIAFETSPYIDIQFTEPQPIQIASQVSHNIANLLSLQTDDHISFGNVRLGVEGSENPVWLVVRGVIPLPVTDESKWGITYDDGWPQRIARWIDLSQDCLRAADLLVSHRQELRRDGFLLGRAATRLGQQADIIEAVCCALHPEARKEEEDWSYEKKLKTLWLEADWSKKKWKSFVKRSKPSVLRNNVTHDAAASDDTVDYEKLYYHEDLLYGLAATCLLKKAGCEPPNRYGRYVKESQ